MVGVQVVVGGDNKDSDLFDFHCKECGRHMLVLVGPETDTCNLCVSHPGWFNEVAKATSFCH